MRCPCRGENDARTYEECCGPYHAGTAQPLSAEVLMRSRYSAFARGDARYLLATWHPATRPAQLQLLMGEQWTGLKIRAAHESGEEATVEFVARSRRGGTPHTLHEVSRFTRLLGRWYYVDGVIA